MLIFELVVFVLAISLDSFAAAICFGACGIRLGVLRSLIIAAVGTLFIAVSIFFGTIIGNAIPPFFSTVTSFFILTIIGLIRIVHSEKLQVQTMSTWQTVSFAVALSIDGLFAGFGAAISECSYIAIPLSFALTFGAVFFGSILGKKLAGILKIDIAKAGGVLLILIAISKLLV